MFSTKALSIQKLLPLFVEHIFLEQYVYCSDGFQDDSTVAREHLQLVFADHVPEVLQSELSLSDVALQVLGRIFVRISVYDVSPLGPVLRGAG